MLERNTHSYNGNTMYIIGHRGNYYACLHGKDCIRRFTERPSFDHFYSASYGLSFSSKNIESIDDLEEYVMFYEGDNLLMDEIVKELYKLGYDGYGIVNQVEHNAQNREWYILGEYTHLEVTDDGSCIKFCGDIDDEERFFKVKAVGENIGVIVS